MVSPDQTGKIRGSMQWGPQNSPKTYYALEFTHMSNTRQKRTHRSFLQPPHRAVSGRGHEPTWPAEPGFRPCRSQAPVQGQGGGGRERSHRFPPSLTRPRKKRDHPQGLGQKPARANTHPQPHTKGTRRLPDLPTRVLRESGPGPLRHGPRPAPAHCAASPSASREASRGRGPFRPGCPATGTQRTHYSVPLHRSEYPRSSPVTRRLAKTARAYMAPLLSAGCNADRQLIGRL